MDETEQANPLHLQAYSGTIAAAGPPASRFAAWIDYRLPIFSFMRRELNEQPTPLVGLFEKPMPLPISISQPVQQSRTSHASTLEQRS